jgi:hypothetical protein
MNVRGANVKEKTSDEGGMINDQSSVLSAFNAKIFLGKHPGG